LIPQELLLKGVSYSAAGLLILPLLFLLLLSVRRETAGGNPIPGILHLGLFLIGLVAFVTLMSGYFRARKMIIPETNSQRMDTADGHSGVVMAAAKELHALAAISWIERRLPQPMQ
jgi:hypothetical protein